MKEGKMWLVCSCGRNLATVDRKPFGWNVTEDRLEVTSRPNVRQHTFEHPGRMLSHPHTYTWYCRCGRTTRRRHAWISQRWVELMSGPIRKDVRVRLEE